MKLQFKIIPFFVFFLPYLGFNQINSDDNTIDSLNALILDNTTHDTVLINSYYYLARVYIYQNPDTSRSFVEKAMKKSEEINYIDGMGEAYGWMGYFNGEEGNIPEAIDYNLKSLYIVEQQGLEENYPVILNNLASLHQDLGNTDQAITYFEECVIINKKLGKQFSLATNYNNLGSAYRIINDFEKALYYFDMSLELRQKIKDRKGISYTYSNMGSVYQLMDSIDIYY